MPADLLASFNQFLSLILIVVPLVVIIIFGLILMMFIDLTK